MPRVKRSINAQKKRRKVLDEAKGYWGLKKSSYRRAKEQLIKSGTYAYRDRRARKREFRRLWITRINAGARAARPELQPAHPRSQSGADRRRPQDPGRSGRPRARSLCPDGRSGQGSAGSRLTAASRPSRESRTVRPGRDWSAEAHHDPRDRRTAEPQRQAGAQAPEEEVPPRARTSGGRGDGPAPGRGGRRAPTSARSSSAASYCQKLPAGLREQAAASGPASRAPSTRTRSPARHRRLRPGDPRLRQFAGRLRRRHLHLPAACRAGWPTSTSAPSLVFYLDGVGDPGNVGTLVRSAVAFGLGGVICSPGTADPSSPKALRAGMGAQFSLPVVTEVEAARPAGAARGAGGQGQAGPAGAGRRLERRDGCARDRRGERPSRRRRRRPLRLVLVLGSERSGPVAPVGAGAAGDHPAAPFRLAERGHGRHRPGLRAEPMRRAGRRTERVTRAVVRQDCPLGRRSHKQSDDPILEQVIAARSAGDLHGRHGGHRGRLRSRLARGRHGCASSAARPISPLLLRSIPELPPEQRPEVGKVRQPHPQGARDRARRAPRRSGGRGAAARPGAATASTSPCPGGRRRSGTCI